MNPILWNADASRSCRSRAPPRTAVLFAHKKTRGSRSANRMVIPWRQGTEHGSRSQFLLSRHPSQIPAATGPTPRGTFEMARNRKQRRQQHGSAWHWKQTDCWYYTPPGTRKRVPLFDEEGERIRGTDNKEAAQLALARIKLSDELAPLSSPVSKEWTVAQVCEI